ncbi:MAG: TRAP transporter large permease [Meiothermus sp.]|uniref:TRAP transporter large permease n=1 Tax=Meiothermus sp. TaxID=1955249 RepID=UPI002638C199|nr:TRAP transporter large permease [Meiothermus sp.]MCS7059290.1 TRAP transporter large permease [Meiothermus sp.]MCX7740966.1 TRAP transporter large permease [Meiothermus sp.]MDW8482110.1 TRAP transporter large permease [Meiothermus sp.]
MLLSLGVFILLLVLGMPVVFAIAIGGLVFFLQQPTLPLTMPVQLLLSETQNFSLLAIPTFILAGNLMNELGVTRRLLQVARVLTGHLRGGLAQVSVVLSLLMGGVSGSAIADATMQARVLGPEMVRRGYSAAFVAALQGFSGLIVVAIPPSIGLILYGSIGQVSIGQLFAGGIGVGLLLAFTYMVVVALLARARGYQPELTERPSARETLAALWGGLWAVLFPVLLLFSLRTGVFVPSEVGAAAVVYALLVGAIYRELRWERVVRAFRNSVADIGMVAFLIAASALIGYGMKWEMIPQSLSQFLVGVAEDPRIALALILIGLLLLGTILDSTVMIILLTPILVPTAKALGLDLVHFGVLMVMTSALGLLTPPVGLSMYSVCSVMRCSVGEYLREGWPLFLAVCWVLLLVYLFPGIVSFLPRLLF